MTEHLVKNETVSIAEIYTPISELTYDQAYQQVFFVSRVDHKSIMKSGTNKRFARITLKDITGEIEGTIWEYNPDKPLKAGMYINTRITTKIFRRRLEFQANISDTSIVPVPVNRYDYIAGASDQELERYANYLENTIKNIADDHYRNIMCLAIEKLTLLHVLRTSPYGLTGPLSFRGGLLKHTVTSLSIAETAAKELSDNEGFNESLITTGCILRNIGWHTTTIWETNDILRARDAFYTIGVPRASARYIDHLMITVKNDLDLEVPEEKKQALENTCFSVEQICTLEGKIIATANEMSNVIHSGKAALKQKSGNWAGELFIGHNLQW